MMDGCRGSENNRVEYDEQKTSKIPLLTGEHADVSNFGSLYLEFYRAVFVHFCTKLKHRMSHLSLARCQVLGFWKTQTDKRNVKSAIFSTKTAATLAWIEQFQSFACRQIATVVGYKCSKFDADSFKNKKVIEEIVPPTRCSQKNAKFHFLPVNMLMFQTLMGCIWSSTEPFLFIFVPN
jgi:hypothetical protein